MADKKQLYSPKMDSGTSGMGHPISWSGIIWFKVNAILGLVKARRRRML
jgi:hypothetical protein